MLTKISALYLDLNTHHGIEEAYVFPELAKRMPNFANGDRHKNAHKVIHAGESDKSTQSLDI